MNDRGRITITDLLWYVVALAALAGLYPVYSNMLGRGLGVDRGTEMVLQAVGPMMLVVLLASVYAKARIGGGA